VQFADLVSYSLRFHEANDSRFRDTIQDRFEGLNGVRNLVNVQNIEEAISRGGISVAAQSLIVRKSDDK
jgi:hypothetical protein